MLFTVDTNKPCENPSSTRTKKRYVLYELMNIIGVPARKIIQITIRNKSKNCMCKRLYFQSHENKQISFFC